MSALPWYKRCPSDHLVAESHLTLEEEAALLRMRDWQWGNGPLPLEAATVAKLIRAPRKAALVADLFTQFFVQTDAGMVDPKLEAQRQRAIGKRANQSRAGALGAEAKHGKRLANATGGAVANAMANAIRPPVAFATLRASEISMGEESTPTCSNSTDCLDGGCDCPAGGAA